MALFLCILLQKRRTTDLVVPNQRNQVLKTTTRAPSPLSVNRNFPVSFTLTLTSKAESNRTQETGRIGNREADQTQKVIKQLVHKLNFTDLFIYIFSL